MKKMEPVVLEGQVVRLEPLGLAHTLELTQAAQDEKIWQYMLYGTIRNQDEMRAWIIDLLGRQARGTDLPFAVIHLESQMAIGATRYMDIRYEHQGIEIGGTWYASAYQRTAVNTESKYLLLKHAFEDIGCIRVQFKTDLRNERSQRALERLGAVKEGILRKHLITPSGYMRDSVMYSILDSDWPQVKTRLEGYLGLK